MSTQERLMQVLIAPHASEKASHIESQNNQITFKVLNNANKHEIGAAVELMFSVKVKAVTVVNQKGKSKRIGRYSGKRSDWKKAYISLQDGQTIDLLTGVQ